jgi:hypothetical protein
MGFIALQKIYTTKTGLLRAKILIETENSTRSYILKITRKTSSMISGNGYAFFVYLIDLDLQNIGILVANKSDKIKFNHIINVGGKITIDTLIRESAI